MMRAITKILLLSLMTLLSAPAVVKAQCAAPDFQNPMSITIGGGPRRATAGDFNSDGKPDLVVANFSINSVTVLLGDGAGGFSAPTNFAVSGRPSDVVVADFNNDGKPDLATTSPDSNSVSILIGNGAGGFSLTTSIGMGANPVGIATADLNRDGKADLITTNNHSASISVRLGNGDGSFGGQAAFSVRANPLHATAGDFNGDGNLDLAVTNAELTDPNVGTSNVSVLLGNGAGSFAAAANYPLPSSALNVTAADFNGDSILDLAVANHNSIQSNVSVLLGNGAGGFGAANTYANGFQLNVVGNADFNGDGKLDLMVSHNGMNDDSFMSILSGDGQGSFGMTVNFDAGALNTQDVAIADFNRDGKPDLVTSNGDGTVTVLLNNCTADCSLLQQQINQLQQQLAAANQTIQSQQQQINQLTQQNSQLQNQLNQLQAQLNIANQTIQSQVQQIAQLQQQLATANQTIQNQQQQITQLNQQNSQLQNQVSQQLATINQLQTQLAAANQQILNQQQQISVLQQELHALINTVSSEVNSVEENLRQTFGDAGFAIPGTTPTEKLHNLVTAISQLNKGQKQGLYKNLGGK